MAQPRPSRFALPPRRQPKAPLPPLPPFAPFAPLSPFPPFALLALLALLVLSACSSTPPLADAAPAAGRDQLQAFLLTGRFALRYDDESYSGRLDWRHDGDDDELLISSPLGQAIAEIVSGAAGARLRSSDGSSRHAASADQLLQAVLGYPLPLDKLADWVRGRSPHAGRLAVDAYGRPAQLLHEDWRIRYEYDGDDRQALPGRLFVEREGTLELRLRIDRWTPLAAHPARRPASAANVATAPDSSPAAHSQEPTR